MQCDLVDREQPGDDHEAPEVHVEDQEQEPGEACSRDAQHVEVRTYPDQRRLLTRTSAGGWFGHDVARDVAEFAGVAPPGHGPAIGAGEQGERDDDEAADEEPLADAEEAVQYAV